MVKKIRVISVLMGLGHVRAAYPLKDLPQEQITLYGSKHSTPPKEYRRWKKSGKFTISSPGKPGNP